MKAVFFAEKDKFGSAKGKLYADDTVSKQSITVRDASSLGKDSNGYYIQIDGDEEAIRMAKEIVRDLARELDGSEAEEINKAIDEQESSAAEGFGSIFG